MTLYYVLFCVYAVLLGATNTAYANFRGSSANAKNFLGAVTGLGFLAIIIVAICNFFIMPWWAAVLLILGYILIVPALSAWLNRIPFFGILASIPTIIVGIILIANLYYLIKS